MSKKLHITILKENSAQAQGLVPGHGLAIAVAARQHNVLFDTGPDDTVTHNAAMLSHDLRSTDTIVLSHGHYDHTGGLRAVLEEIGPVRIVAHPGIFDETFSGPSPAETHAIGIPEDRALYERLGGDFHLSEMPVKLSEELMATGRIPLLNPQYTTRAGLWRRGNSGIYPDDFRDDLALIARLDGCVVVLTGCAHTGLINILCKVRTITGGQEPLVVVGGLHLNAATDEQVIEVAHESRDMGVQTLMPGHCTGQQAMEVLADVFPGQVLPLTTGMMVDIHANGETIIRRPNVACESQ